MKSTKVGLALSLVVLFSGLLTASAQSFDCEESSTPFEKAICSDETLSDLDEQLAKSYEAALLRAGKDAATLRLDQKQWLDGTSRQCSGDAIAKCILDALNERIGKLNSTSRLPATEALEFRLFNSSPLFDFVIRMQARVSESPSDDREGPGEVLVYRKGNRLHFQTIFMDNICVSVDESGHPITDSGHVSEDQGVISVGDFNFDGHEDFAVQNGNDGPYGQPTFSAHLFAPSLGVFQKSAALSALTDENMGLFQVDSVHKRLYTFSRSGCCSHATTEYSVKGDLPLPVSRVVEDSSKDSKHVLISHEVYEDGVWKRSTEQVPQTPDKTPR